MSKKHKHDLRTIEQVLEMRTADMIDACTDLLLSYYPPINGKPQVFILDDNFVYAVGSGPITLVSHVDTVRDHFVPVAKAGAVPGKSWRKDHGNSPMKLSRTNNILTNSNGVLGADDRAGVFGCLELVRRCKKEGLPMPSILLTNGEESGGIGVGVFVSTSAFEKYDGGRTRLFVEMDRCNAVEWVTYGAQLPREVIDYVESFGFKKGHGSYSDIADLQEEYQIPAVNLSIGYYLQHSDSERLHVDEMYMTINRVFAMLRNPIDKLYPVKPQPKYSAASYHGFGGYDSSGFYGNSSKTTGGKGNVESGKENTKSTTSTFPHSQPGKTGVDDVLDAITKGGFCRACGHMWSDCECGNLLKEIVKHLTPTEIRFLKENYLFEVDPMHALLSAYLEMEDDLAHGGEKIDIESGEVIVIAPEKDPKDPFFVGEEGAPLLITYDTSTTEGEK